MTKAEQKLRVYRIFRFCCWSCLRLWNRFETRGSENVPAEGGCIIAANHASYLDPPVVGCGVPHRVVRFMARDTLYKKGFVNWLFTHLATIPIARGKGDIAALKKSLHILKDGYCLGVFPEGTRTNDGQLQEAKGGIGFLIAKASVPVVPAYVDGTFVAYPRGSKTVRPARIRVRFGTPIWPAEIAALGSGRDVYERAAALVMSRIAALRDSA
jgi:1-acyl-sn-glycerol-3-phosphate acyltransferase